MNPAEAEAIALNVLGFLIRDETRQERFMTLSGMDPSTLRNNASDPDFLAGILDYLLQDETLIYLFASEHNVTPEVPAQARRALDRGDTGEY